MRSGKAGWRTKKVKGNRGKRGRTPKSEGVKDRLQCENERKEGENT